MTPILFYGVPAGCSFGSIVALEWLQIPYRLCRIDMLSEEIRSEDYRRVNPVAETPSLLTADGRLLSESMAILGHLAPHGVGAGLAFAQGSAGFDRLNQMLAFLNTSLFGGFSPLWYAYEHELGDEAKAVLRDFGSMQLEKAHADLAAMLGEGPYLLGERPTLADAYFYGIARWAEYHGIPDRSAWPGLQGLVGRLADDPAVRFAEAIEKGETAVSTGGFQGHVSLGEALGALGKAA
ncbi:glutathione S-transferase family protein [Stappia sp.]|uniref:glutathione S-transferase family protein n=1 Tax=Stappia sp. TaxID=1870903 RepID=UPI003A9A31AA